MTKLSGTFTGTPYGGGRRSGCGWRGEGGGGEGMSEPWDIGQTFEERHWLANTLFQSSPTLVWLNDEYEVEAPTAYLVRRQLRGLERPNVSWTELHVSDGTCAGGESLSELCLGGQFVKVGFWANRWRFTGTGRITAVWFSRETKTAGGIEIVAGCNVPAGVG